MTPSGPCARAVTVLTFGSSSSRVFTARDSFTSPRFVTTTLCDVPALKSASLFCVQCDVETASTGPAKIRAKRGISLFMKIL